jgi:hypothetical protein
MIGASEDNPAQGVEKGNFPILELPPQILAGIGWQRRMEHLPDADCHA